MFLLDSNIFISSYRTFYAPSFCNGFWQVLDILYKNNRWCSLDMVYRELTRDSNSEKADYVCKWAENRQSCFLTFDANEELGKINDYLDNQAVKKKFNPLQVEKFLNGADPFIIAYAMKHKLTLVTQETPVPDSKYEDPQNKTKIKIPNVCNHFNVKYKMLWGFMKDNDDIINLVQVKK